MAALALGLASGVAAESAVRSVEVQSIGEAYVIDLVMWTPVARELAFEVLVDFEHVANWTPNIRESRVLRRDVDRVTVEYQGSVRFGPLMVPFTTVRDVAFSAPAVIESTQIRGTMKRHQSRIGLTPEGAGTRLDYHVEMVPSAMAAPLLSKGRLEQELRENFDAMAAEMLRRAGAATTAR